MYTIITITEVPGLHPRLTVTGMYPRRKDAHRVVKGMEADNGVHYHVRKIRPLKR